MSFESSSSKPSIERFAPLVPEREIIEALAKEWDLIILPGWYSEWDPDLEEIDDFDYEQS